MPTESELTRDLCRELEALGCLTQAIVCGTFMKGVPDRYVLNPSGVATWLEMKRALRRPPDVYTEWKPLFGAGRALQDEFVRQVCKRNARAACVLVLSENPDWWAMYRPATRPGYRCVLRGRDAILTEILRRDDAAE